MYVRGQAYRKRFGTAFTIIGAVFIDAIMPLAAQLVEFHFGLSDTEPPRRLSLNETRWLEGLAKSHLEGSFSQMQKIEHYGGSEEDMKEALYKRANLHPLLRALLSKCEEVHRKWVVASAPVFSSKLPYGSPDKLILNQFFATGASRSLKSSRS